MKTLFTFLCAFLLTITSIKAQLNYNFSALSGTYTPISGGNTAVLQQDGSGYEEHDEGYANALPIGFNFNYNGVTYSTISANSNGFASFQNFSQITNTNKYDYYTADLLDAPYSETNTRPVLAPLWDDLDLYSYAGIKYITTGSAPFRVFTLEWNDVYWDIAASNIGISFQLKLYESTNIIEFHYRQQPGAVSSTASAAIGITATGTGDGNYLALTNSSASPTASSTIDTYTINAKPATNQIYRFLPPNSAPILAAISNQTVDELSLLTFTASATDPNPGQTLTYSLANAPSGASINPATGEFAWTPTEAQGQGVYNVKVRASDNGTPVMYAERTVTITVNEVNTAPVLAAIGNKSVNELTSLSFTASATDADLPAQALAYTLVGAPAGAAINSSTGVFNWTPTEAQGGSSYTFTVRVSDNASSPLTSDQPVTITVNKVNSAPVLAAISNKTGNELSAISFTAVATDADLPAQAITYSLDGAPAGATIDPATGTFSWTPTEAQGPASYTFIVRATDNAISPLSSERTVTITVNEVNTVPVLTAIPNKMVDELAALSFTASATDPDLPAQSLSFSLIGAPAGATIDPATGLFNWTPTEQQGPNNYTFRVRVTDLGNGAPPQSAEQSVTVTVNEVNVAPVLASIGNKTVAALSALKFKAAATDVDKPSQTIVFSLTGTIPSGASINAASGDFSWTPTQAQAPGSYTFGIRATDNGSPSLFAEEQITVTVLEAAANKTPVLNPIGNKTVNELAVLTFTASATDADVPAQTLSYSLIGAPAGATINASTGAFSWTPTEAQGPQTYAFKVRVSDNGSPVMFAEEQITVTVNEVNLAPVLGAIANRTVNELSALTFTASATDADLPAQALSYSLVGAPAGAAINPTTGVFSWTPSEVQGAGTYTFIIRVTDNALSPLSAERSVTITVNEVNIAPVLAPIANKTTNELSTLTFTASATDADLPVQSISYSLVGAPAGAVIDAATGVFNWTPAEAQGPGSYTFKVRASDNASSPLSSEQPVSITVNEINVAPVLAAIGNKTVNALSSLTFTAKATDADLPAQTLNYSLTGTVPAGAVINTTTGVFNWTPTASQGPGSYIFGIKVTDNGSPAMFDEEIITVTVTDIKNAAPVLASIGNKTVNEMSLLTFTASATDTDVPAQTLTFSLQGAVPSGAVINPQTGVFKWTPSELQGPNAYTFKVRATDNGTPALFAEEQITVTVNEVVEVNKPITIKLKKNCSFSNCVTLSGSTFGLTPPFTYTWNTGQTSSSITVCPDKDITYSLTIQGAYETSKTDFVINVNGQGCRNKKVKKNKKKDLVGGKNNGASMRSSLDVDVPTITKAFLYPNPAPNKQFHVSLKDNSLQSGSLFITDILGRKVYVQMSIKNEMDIDLKGHPKGLYLVHIVRNDKESTIKVILQ